MAANSASAPLRDLLLTTKDGDWGKDSPEDGYVPYRVIRGTDFPGVRIGDISAVPVRYLSESTVHRRTLEPDDILLETAGGSRDRPTGRSLLVTKKLLSSLDLPATCASFARFLRVNRAKADPRYVYWHLQNLYANGEMEEHQVQHTGVARFQYTKFAETQQIPLLALPEQRAIAHILGTLDDKMELNRRMNETLEAMARAIFKSWFVDFDPVRAKHALSKVEGADGRPSTSSGQAIPGLPKHLADLFPDSFEDSEVGEVPKGWKVKAIEAIAKRVGMGPFGSSIKVETFVPEGVPVISGRHLHSFMVEDNTFNFVAHEHAERLRTANVQRGDVVFTHAGNIGQVAYIPENSRYDRYVISQRQFFVRCDLAQVTPSFVAFYFSSPEGQHRLLANASSSGVPSIARPVTYLRSIQLTIPPKPVMDAFEKSVQPLLTQFRRNLNEVSTLAALRDALLPKLMSGDLRMGVAPRGDEHVPA